MTPFQTLFLLGELVIAILMCWTIASMTMSLWHGAPFVPTSGALVEKILAQLPLKKGAKFLELGCGDGRIVCTAVKKYGVIGRGVEISWLWILLARMRAYVMGVSPHTHILHQNITHTDLAWADVIYIYMMPRFLDRYGKDILRKAKSGTVVASHTFEIEAITDKKTRSIDMGRYTLHLYLL